MSALEPGTSRATSTILVVDDDRRVVELLGVALTAYGFRVLNAADGDEAIRVATRERPDLVVLDVRLPRRSGLEVCELLRQDPEDPQVPIIMVSAAAETESRLQGLARGADDYIAKPFSPKELIARIKRLLVRSAESREARRRGREAEHELGQAREDAKRSHAELRGEQRLRELTHAFVREFHGLLDGERLAARLLLAVHTHLGVGMVGLLGATAERGLRAEMVRGDAFRRVASLVVRPGGELETLLGGLGRPIRRRELERLPELEAELGPFVAAGVFVLAPLRDAEGLLGVLVADEPCDGRDLDREQLESLAVLCDTASLAMRNARRCLTQAEGMLEAIAATASRRSAPEAVAARSEAAALADAAAEGLLPATTRRILIHAVGLGSWLWHEDGRRALETISGRDPSGLISRLRRLLEQSQAGAAAEEMTAEERRAASLATAALAYGDARAAGIEPTPALALAAECVPPGEVELRDALERALPSRASLRPRATASPPR